MAGFKWVPKCKGSQRVILDYSRIEADGSMVCPECRDFVRTRDYGEYARINNHGDWRRIREIGYHVATPDQEGNRCDA